MKLQNIVGIVLIGAGLFLIFFVLAQGGVASAGGGNKVDALLQATGTKTLFLGFGLLIYGIWLNVRGVFATPAQTEAPASPRDLPQVLSWKKRFYVGLIMSALIFFFFWKAVEWPVPIAGPAALILGLIFTVLGTRSPVGKSANRKD